MKGLALISVLFLMSGCSLHLKTDTKQDGDNVCIEKEFHVGPKVGQN